jgi:multisubunit Na+/H+ antiporter MnhB subunit
MIVIKGLIGLLLIASAIGILYGLGKINIRLSQEFDEDDNPEFIDIIMHGFIMLMLLGLCFVLILLAYAMGNSLVDEFFK